MATGHSFPGEAAERLAPWLPQMKTKAAYQRFQCVWLRATLGLSALQIAQALGWQPQSVRQLQSDYAREGEAVLWGKPHGGRRHAHFTAEQEKALLAPFLEQAQAGGVLVVAPVQAAYAKALGRSVHPSLVYRALHRPGGRKVVPRPKHPKSSEEAREAFKKVTGDRARASSGAGRPHWSAGARVCRMFEDEARLGRSRDPRRCWAPVGVRPAVEVQVEREYEYAFAAVSPHDGVLDTLVLPTAKAEAMSVFLAAVAHERVSGCGRPAAPRRVRPDGARGRGLAPSQGASGTRQ